MLAVAEAEALYESLAELPTVAGVEWIGSQAHLILSSTDHAFVRKTSLGIALNLRQHLSEPRPELPLDRDSTVRSSFASESQRVRVLLRDISEQDGKRSVEVWDGSHRLHCVDVSGAHGPFITERE